MRKVQILRKATGNPEPPGRGSGVGPARFPKPPAASSRIPLEGSRPNATQARPKATGSSKCDRRGPHFRTARNLGAARRVGRKDHKAQETERAAWPRPPRKGREGAAGHKRQPQRYWHRPPPPAPSAAPPAPRPRLLGPRPRLPHHGPARGPALSRGHRPLSLPPAPPPPLRADPTGWGEGRGERGEQRRGHRPLPRGHPPAPPAGPAGPAGPAASAHRSLDRSALVLPPARNDERSRPARALPARHFRGQATSARAGRAAESACARRGCRERAAAILRGWPRGRIPRGRRGGRDACGHSSGCGFCAFCRRHFSVPGDPTGQPANSGGGQCHGFAAARAERGRGVAFPRGAGTRVCRARARPRKQAAVAPRGRAGPAAWPPGSDRRTFRRPRVTAQGALPGAESVRREPSPSTRLAFGRPARSASRFRESRHWELLAEMPPSTQVLHPRAPTVGGYRTFRTRSPGRAP